MNQLPVKNVMSVLKSLPKSVWGYLTVFLNLLIYEDPEKFTWRSFHHLC